MILNSMTQLREVAGLKPIKKKKEKPLKCKKCGNEMRKVAENMWVCENITEDKKCDNIYIRKHKPH